MSFRISLLMAAILGLTACNTIGGLGRDVEAGGQAIEDTAGDVQN